MAVFKTMQVTNSGRAVYARAMNGSAIEITNVRVGSGRHTEGIAEKTGLAGETLTASIKEIDTTTDPSVCRIDIEIKNKTDGYTLSTPFLISEIGVFVKNTGDANEVMYAYSYAEEANGVIQGDTIPAYAIDNEVTWQMSIALSLEGGVEASGNATVQNTLSSMTPTVSADSGTLSDVLATCLYNSLNGLVTAFYEVTGEIINANGITSLKISLPSSTASKDVAVPSQMVVTETDGTTVVDVMATVDSANKNIDVSWFGGRNGTFKLLMTAIYPL